METVQSEIWPPAPELNTDVPNYFEVEGVRMTRMHNVLRVENVNLRRFTIAAPFVLVSLWGLIACYLAYVLYTPHFPAYEIVVLVALCVGIGVLKAEGLCIFHCLIGAHLLLLDRSNKPTQSRLLDLGAIRDCQEISVRKDMRSRRRPYIVCIKPKLPDHPNGLIRIWFFLQRIFLRTIFRSGAHYIPLVTFRDEANAERVAQMIADFANVPIEHRVSDGQ